jgi:hypothetical protein
VLDSSLPSGTSGKFIKRRWATAFLILWLDSSSHHLESYAEAHASAQRATRPTSAATDIRKPHRTKWRKWDRKRCVHVLSDAVCRLWDPVTQSANGGHVRGACPCFRPGIHALNQAGESALQYVESTGLGVEGKAEPGKEKNTRARGGGRSARRLGHLFPRDTLSHQRRRCTFTPVLLFAFFSD